MSDEPQPRFWDPFGELTPSGMSQKEVIDIWRAQCWALYLNGGGGDPSYFDYPAYLKMHAQERER
jgi:hypothetical protein